jgi:hypothetical protein
MTQSNAERQRQWRERQKQAGYRAMVVWLPPEAVDILTRYPEKERGHVILNALRNTPSNTPVTIPGTAAPKEHPAGPCNEGADTGPPAMLSRLEMLESKVESLTQAVQGLVTGNTPVTLPGNSQVTLHGNNAHPPAKAKAPSAEELAQAAQSLRTQGLSYAQIAERWEKEKVPTLKGGRWHKGTIGKLVQRYAS